MIALSDFRTLGPFTADKLIDAVNAILRARGAQPIAKRTLRFYTSQGVVPSPMGSPKFARYGYEHLLSLVGARAMQDQGLKLAAIIENLKPIRQGNFESVEALINTWIEMPSNRSSMVRESASNYSAAMMMDRDDLVESYVGTPARVIQLTPNSELRILGNVPVRSELAAANDAIRRIMER